MQLRLSFRKVIKRKKKKGAQPILFIHLAAGNIKEDENLFVQTWEETGNRKRERKGHWEEVERQSGCFFWYFIGHIEDTLSGNER